MKCFFIAFLLFLFFNDCEAQMNCSNPVSVSICPAVLLTLQSNAGMLDDAPSSCNIPGEDLVYDIYAPDSAIRIYVSIINATGTLKLTLNTGSCSSLTCYSYSVPAGTSNYTFNVSKSNHYYLWVDAAGVVEYDISIGGDSTQQNVSIPNTQGNLSFDNCAPVPFSTAKRFLEVKYNNVFQTQPMTLSPLNSTGTMCVTIYLKNISGVSGAQLFRFVFDPTGYQTVNPSSQSIPGFYNAGDWRAGPPGFFKDFTFVDSVGIGRGDFTGSPNSCLKYTFCFDILPISNDPNQTNVVVEIYNDLYGAGYSGALGSGCCPINFPNCHTVTGITTGSSPWLAFGFNDPGQGLPVDLKFFSATPLNDAVKIAWVTSTEINNDYFTLENSQDGQNWNPITTMNGAGNSSEDRYYTFQDPKPFEGLSYYRLSQTDFDGKVKIFQSASVHFNRRNILIYPNPASNMLNIEMAEPQHCNVSLFDYFGKETSLSVFRSENKMLLDLSSLRNGLYYLQLREDGNVILSEKIIISKD